MIKKRQEIFKISFNSMQCLKLRLDKLWAIFLRIDTVNNWEEHTMPISSSKSEIIGMNIHCTVPIG